MNLAKNLSLGIFGCIVLGLLFGCYYKLSGDNNAIYITIAANVLWSMFIGLKFAEENKVKK